MPVTRKLVAVVMADVVGYSRLMERDEAGTHQRLRGLNDELLTRPLDRFRRVGGRRDLPHRQEPGGRASIDVFGRRTGICVVREAGG